MCQSELKQIWFNLKNKNITTVSKNASHFKEPKLNSSSSAQLVNRWVLQRSNKANGKSKSVIEQT